MDAPTRTTRKSGRPAVAQREGSAPGGGRIRSHVTEREGAHDRVRVLLEERERLAQDLHDNCIQSIFAVGLSLEAALPLVGKDPSRVAATIGNAAANLNLVIQELRACISGSGDPADGIRDFRGEIERAVHALGSRAPRFAVDIETAAAAALSPEQAVQLLHIAREGISNIARHSRARAARVALHLRDHVVRLELSDNGKGFDFRNRARRGMGLHHIEARARKLGARCRIVSAAGHGCRIVVALQAAR